MGTTVTTNLALIKPDVDESIKEDLPTFAGWAAQNGINMDKLDALFRATNHTYTPAWTAATTNPTLGAGGFVEGKYLRLWPKMIIGHLRINVGGAGASGGTGFYSISVPATISTELSSFADSVPVGKAAFLDSSAVLTCTVFEIMYGTASNTFFLKDPAGIAWSNSAPVAIGQDDKISGFFMYPTNAA